MVIRVGRGGGGRGGVSMEVDKFRKKRKMKRNEFEFGRKKVLYLLKDCFGLFRCRYNIRNIGRVYRYI